MLKVWGKLEGKDVEATRNGDDIRGDALLLGAAVDKIKRGESVYARPDLPETDASLSSDFAFVVTVGSCLDAGTVRYDGLKASDVPSDDPPPGRRGVVH